MSFKRTLILFIRNPELGKVKTRLAKGVGDEKALAIYQELLRHTRKISRAVSARKLLYYTHFIPEKDEWAEAEFEKRLQAKEGDLGLRMRQAFEEALQSSKRVLIMGSDCPLLTSEQIEQAFSLLEEHPYVLGPAADGGYYLLGMRKPTPELFDRMPWSTDQVADLTLKRIREMGASYGLLPVLPDIDHAEDWEKYGWEF
jgi:hypothetical protein